MDTDFFDAHKRHWDDAETLFSASRLANADHLFGLSAECGLKRLMISFGMKVDPVNGIPLDRKYDRKHIDEIWGRYEAYRSGHSSGPGYSLGQNPFHDWEAGQRYARAIDFENARVAPHREGARDVNDLISKALKDGLII